MHAEETLRIHRLPTGHEPSVQTLKQMFADHSTPQAGTSRAAAVVEDDEHELDPEYAPKRFHTTQVSCSAHLCVQTCLILCAAAGL